MHLARAVLAMTDAWPRDERFALTDQVRRAAVSIPANIAEGQGRLGRRELRHHLSIAHGSLCELETLLELVEGSPFTDDATLGPTRDLAAEVGRILRGLMRSIE
jgi:four helix bundle protein